MELQLATLQFHSVSSQVTACYHANNPVIMVNNNNVAQPKSSKYLKYPR